jgi:hypothetical protein
MNLRYLQESELKHARVAMLAVVGFLATQFVHIPGDAYQEADPIKAVNTVGLGVDLQVLAGIGFVELATWDKTYSGTGAPGDFGFDGGQLKGKSAKDIADLKLKEIKNGMYSILNKGLPRHL